jgi:NTE family protein
MEKLARSLPPRDKPRVALVLGSGAARGWAHIGVIRELEDMGIKPDLVVGASVGAVVAGAYASGNLDPFEAWISSLGRFDIIRLLDAKMTGGGFLQGNSLMNAIEKRIGRTSGIFRYPAWPPSWAPAARCGCASSLLTPAARRSPQACSRPPLTPTGCCGRCLVGRCRSLARAIGRDVVIAVNLNGDLVSRHFFVHGRTRRCQTRMRKELAEIEDKRRSSPRWAAKMKAGFGVRWIIFLTIARRPGPGPVRRHRRRARHHTGPHHAFAHGGEPPDILITRVSNIADNSTAPPRASRRGARRRGANRQSCGNSAG